MSMHLLNSNRIRVEYFRAPNAIAREEPQIHLSDQDTLGTLLTNDVSTYKVRHLFTTGLVEYRGAVKAIVP
jgi:hypothetical protein